MALYGPFTYESAPTGSILSVYSYRKRIWYRTKPVGREETPFQSFRAKGVGTATRLYFNCTSNIGHRRVSQHTHGQTDSERDSLVNRCYGQLIEKVRGEHGGVQGLTFLAELGESFEMISKRALQFYRAGRALRKGNFRDFLDEFSIKPLPHHRDLRRTKAREASGLWLEYWFGWAPSLSDVYNAVNVLQQPIPAQRFSARSSRNLEVAESGYKWTDAAVVKLSVSMRATVTVSNPNLWLANQLGLINPAQTALELIPFSWLAGWWVNLSQVLGSYTDWFGLNVTNSSTTLFGKCHGFAQNSDPYYNQNLAYDTWIWQRSLGIQKPVLKITGLKGLSVTRAATSASLVTQMFLSDLKGATRIPRI